MQTKLGVILLLVLLFCLAGMAFGQVDADGDLNADVTDPFPADPLQGGVYVGGTITYDVLMAGDLDATGFTGTVITIGADGVTFDGNGYQILAPDAQRGIEAEFVQNIAVQNVTIVSPNSTGLRLNQVNNSTVSGVTSTGPGTGNNDGTGTGLAMTSSSDNVIEDCIMFGRSGGIEMQGSSNNNVIQNNDFSKAGSPGTGGSIIGSGSGNRFLNNNCSGGKGVNVPGLSAEISGNDMSNSQSSGLVLFGYSNASSLVLQDVISQNTFSGSQVGIKLQGVVSGTVISNLDFTGVNATSFPLEVSSSNGVTLSNLNLPGVHGLFLNNVDGSTISEVTSVGTGGGDGITLRSCSNNLVERCVLSGRNTGITADSGGDNNTFQDNNCRQATSSGINVQTGSGHKFIANDCSESSSGMLLKDPVEVSNNDLSLCSSSSLIIGAYSGSVNLQAVITSNMFSGSGTGMKLQQIVSGTTVSDLDFSGMGVLSFPLSVTSSQNITLSRLTIPGVHGLFLSNVDGSTINEVTSIGTGGGDGITLRSCSDNLVERCVVSGRNTGITADSGGDNNTFEDNDCRQATSSGINVQTGSGHRFIDNDCSESSRGMLLSNAAEVRDNLIVNCTNTGLSLGASSGTNVFHNNIFGNGLNVSSSQPIELSFNGEGNYWGHSCPGPLFTPGTDSNDPNVVDSFPYGVQDGWESGETPGCNDAPVANAGPDQTVECTSDAGAEVTLDGSGSSDPDEDQLTYTWRENGNIIAGPTADATVQITLSLGSHTITLTVDDGGGGTDTDEVIVTIEDTTPPTITSITAPIDPNEVNTEISASADFTDACGAPHTAEWNWGDVSTSAGAVDEQAGTVTGSHTYTGAGVYTVTLTLTDDHQNASVATFQFVVIYDPDAGFVTGGGWIDSPEGAYTPDPSLTGQANFGFVSKYKKGKSTPDGNTQFNFHVANLNFKSTEYDWLVIAGPKAKYKGSGTINNDGNYGFMLTARDGQVNGGGGVDRFRIKIWDKDDDDTVVYDNQMDDPDDGDATDAIEGGSIVIHSQGNAKYSDGTSEDFSPAAVPEDYALLQNFPNPFNPETQIRFQLPQAGHVVIRIFNTLGQEIRTLIDSPYDAGFHALTWDSRDNRGNPVSSGVYLYQIQAGHSSVGSGQRFRQVRKMSLVR